jgi:hypothetical protein
LREEPASAKRLPESLTGKLLNFEFEVASEPEMSGHEASSQEWEDSLRACRRHGVYRDPFDSKYTLSLKYQVMEQIINAAYIEFGSGMNKLNHLNNGRTSDGVR